MKQKLAVITGADGGMGMEITRAVATAGYKVIMACRDPEIAEEKRQLIMRETGNIALEIVPVNLASLSSTASFANELLQRGEQRMAVHLHFEQVRSFCQVQQCFSCPLQSQHCHCLYPQE